MELAPLLLDQVETHNQNNQHCAPGMQLNSQEVLFTAGGGHKSNHTISNAAQKLLENFSSEPIGFISANKSL